MIDLPTWTDVLALVIAVSLVAIVVVVEYKRMQWTMRQSPLMSSVDDISSSDVAEERRFSVTVAMDSILWALEIVRIEIETGASEVDNESVIVLLEELEARWEPKSHTLAQKLRTHYDFIYRELILACTHRDLNRLQQVTKRIEGLRERVAKKPR